MERSDYELYQLLESNGYKTTKENLELLKESDSYFISESGDILTFEEALDEAARMLTEQPELLDDATDEELVALAECFEQMSLNEAVGQAGEGSVQQKIQGEAQKKVDTARKSAVSAANTFTNKAHDAWNARKGFGNFFRRHFGSAESRQAAKEEREAGLKKRQQYLNRAQGAVKGYNTRMDRVNADRQAKQVIQNNKSAATRQSQLNKKYGKGSAEAGEKMAQFRSGQTTGAAVQGQGGELKKRNWFQRTFSKNKNVYTEEVEISDYELYQVLEDNGYKTTEDNLRILKEGLESGKYSLYE